MGDTLTSRCSCGQVSAEATGLPTSVVNCHCTDCRRATGAVYGTLLYFQADAVEITGVTASHDVVSDRGTVVTRQFCPTCGSQMFASAAAWPELIGLRAGTIDQTEFIQPERNVFAASRIESTPIDPALPVFPGMPGL